MPPPPDPNRHQIHQSIFGRRHRRLSNLLLLFSWITSPLTFLSIMWSTKALNRPLWERNTMWGLALGSFLSRWAVVGTGLVWIVGGWDEAGERREQEQAADERRREELRRLEPSRSTIGEYLARREAEDTEGNGTGNDSGTTTAEGVDAAPTGAEADVLTEGETATQGDTQEAITQAEAALAAVEGRSGDQILVQDV